MTWKKTILVGILALSLGAGGAQARGDLITNGDFTSYTAGADGPSQLTDGTLSNSVALSQGYTVLTGWSSQPSTSGLGYNYTFFYTAPGDVTGSYAPLYETYTKIWGTNDGGPDTGTMPPGGGNYIAMDGTSPVATPLEQTVSGLTVGQSYSLTFQWAAGQFYGYSGATTESWQVSLGSDTQSTTTYDNVSLMASPAGWERQ